MDQIAVTWKDMQVNNLFLIILGMGVLTGTFFFFRLQMKKNPDLKIGDIINKLIIENKTSICLFGAALANFFEAMVSASIHPPGQMPINAFTRFGAHGIVAFVAISFSIFFAQYFRAFLSAAFSGKMWKKAPELIFIRLFLTIIFLVGMVVAPLFNLFIVANGTMEVMDLRLFIYDIIYVDSYMEEVIYPSVGLPTNYDPFVEMSYVMAASLVMTIFHYFLMIGDAVMTLDRDRSELFDFGTKIKTINERVNDRSDKEKKEDMKGFGSAVRFLILRYGGYSGKALENVISDATSRLDKLDGQQGTANKVKISGVFAKLRNEITNFDNNEKPTLIRDGKQDEVDKRNDKFDERIAKAFSGKINNGEGLGITLKAKK